LIGAIAILAALSKRDRTGSGAYVEIPMFESMVAFTAVEHFYGHHFEPPKGPAAFPRVMARGRRPFLTADGYISVQPNTDAHWRNLFLACGEVALADDPRFAGIAARTENVDALYSALASLLRTRTSAEWLGLMQEMDVPCGTVNALADLTRDPHLAATEFFTKLDQGDGSSLTFPGVPVLFDGKRPPIRMPPRLGEHDENLVGGAGFDSF
jgi:crotonobetainyl-CoA:carnitine CoA-transferase CaiB-like acyl-CoA transferase